MQIRLNTISKDRIEVPEMHIDVTGAGKRVSISLPGIDDSLKYAALFLPKNWKSGKKYPLIVEFPGNIFYTKDCYSTGRPEQCVIGYGMDKREKSIWLSIPFVDYSKKGIAENGWGNPEHTADYTYRLVQHVIDEYGGDRDKIVLTGFSRGAIACGFIGLRNDSIASLWRGIHACQHYDGDGWGGSELEDAKERLQQFTGSYFHTDNNKEQPRIMLDETGVDAVFVSSGLGAHASAMFLDNRESTVELRRWYKKLIRD